MKRELGVVKHCPASGVGNIKVTDSGRVLSFNVADLPDTLYVGDQVSFCAVLSNEQSWATDIEAAGPIHKLSATLRQLALKEADRKAHRHASKTQQRTEFLKKLDAIPMPWITAEQKARELFEGDFLNAEKVRKCDPGSYPAESEFEELRIEFAEEWISQNLQMPLDEDQIEAVVAREQNVLVRARAGSGKTRTLVCRALFLIKHCRVPPHEVLIIAFNNKAVEEIKKRLKEHIGSDLPLVMTFHALAHAFVHPEETLIYDDNSGSQKQSHEVQRVIDGHLRDRNTMQAIRDLMMRAFREDWEAIIRGRHDKSKEEFLEYRRGVARETLGGDYVKSYGERLIANALFEHDVRYKYEDSHQWGEFFYRPDFTVWQNNSRVIIEYFGMEGDKDYDVQTEQKKAYCKGRGITLLEYRPSDVAAGAPYFVSKLLADLKLAGIEATKLTEEEIWLRVKDRAIDSFTRATRQFVTRCRNLNYSSQDLRSLINGHLFLTDVERDFAEVAALVHRDYLGHLINSKMEDFDGLMWRAVDIVSGGVTGFARNKGEQRGDASKIRFVMIDEYQDFSKVFDELVCALQKHNDKMELFCVGDDWQAINRFAGSDSTYFTSFTGRLEDSAEVDVLTNYRSGTSITLLGNALMARYGRQAKPLSGNEDGKCELGYIDKFVATDTERRALGGDELSPAVLRIIEGCIKGDSKSTVALLARRKNWLPWRTRMCDSQKGGDLLGQFEARLRSYFPEETRHRITVSTIHAFKGRESDTVVILDAVRGSIPFVHPHWQFTRIFGDSLDQLSADERRLFYVALSRAKRHLILLTEAHRESKYINELQESGLTGLLKWDEWPIPEYPSYGHLEIEVAGGYEFRSELRRSGFQFDFQHKVWRKQCNDRVLESVVLEAKELGNMGLIVRVIDDTGQRLYSNE